MKALKAWFAAHRKLLIDIAERAVWTGAQAGVGLVSIDKLGLPGAWIVPAGLILSAVKGTIASHVGDDTSAAALPGKVQ